MKLGEKRGRNTHNQVTEQRETTDTCRWAQVYQLHLLSQAHTPSVRGFAPCAPPKCSLFSEPQWICRRGNIRERSSRLRGPMHSDCCHSEPDRRQAGSKSCHPQAQFVFVVPEKPHFRQLACGCNGMRSRCCGGEASTQKLAQTCDRSSKMTGCPLAA